MDKLSSPFSGDASTTQVSSVDTPADQLEREKQESGGAESGLLDTIGSKITSITGGRGESRNDGEGVLEKGIQSMPRSKNLAQ